jgi:hypothetical protein
MSSEINGSYGTCGGEKRERREKPRLSDIVRAVDTRVPECARCFEEEGSYGCVRYAHMKPASRVATTQEEQMLAKDVLYGDGIKTIKYGVPSNLISSGGGVEGQETMPIPIKFNDSLQAKILRFKIYDIIGDLKMDSDVALRAKMAVESAFKETLS